MPKLSFQYVTGPHGRETLVDFLARRFRYHDAAEWDELVREGRVSVNGMPARPQHILKTSERVAYERPRSPEPEVDERLTVLFEDDHLIAVDKSGNLPTSPSGKYWDHCLIHLLQRTRGLQRLYAVHRLDRETSGVNVLAKNHHAARALGDDFARGQVAKSYVAVLRGGLEARSAYVSAPLAGDQSGEVRIRQVASLEGRETRTRFTLLARLPRASLVRVEPLTGRTHQIRAHAQVLGHPVWGDKLYGRSDAEFLAWVHLPRNNAEPRQLLHASSLTFRHPVTGSPLTIRSSARQLLDRFYEDLASRTG